MVHYVHEMPLLPRTTRHRGPVTDHFDGKRFHNVPHTPHAGAKDMLRWTTTRRPAKWSAWTENPSFAPPPARIAASSGVTRVTFVNHATVLVQVGDLAILTDPVYSERTSPVQWAGPRRHRAPGVAFEALPKIDVVLVSHNHYDHLDVETLRRLEARDAPLVITGLGNDELLRAEGLQRVHELDWWSELDVEPGVRVTGVPAQHFSGRGLDDRDATLWLGFVVASGDARIYFAGDTGYGPFFREIRERLDAPTLSLLPIGAYEPRWFMGPVHMDPDDAVRAHLDLGSLTSVGIHFGTFQLTDEAQDAPVVELARAREKYGIDASRFFVLEHGEGRDVVGHVEPPAEAWMRSAE